MPRCGTSRKSSAARAVPYRATAKPTRRPRWARVTGIPPLRIATSGTPPIPRRGDQLVPWGRVVHPAPPHHGGDDPDLGELLRRAGDGVAVEDDEVGEVARDEPPAPVLVACEPGGVDRAGGKRLLDRDSLFRMPGGPLVESAKDAGSD